VNLDPIEVIIEILHVVNKCPDLNTLDKSFIYARREGGGNIDNDKNTVNNNNNNTNNI
jgi:hypothetical protein